MEYQKTNKGLFLSIITTLLHSQLAYCLVLLDYQTASFTNPFRNSEFTKLTIHNKTGEIYIGGGNALHRLAADFTRQESVNTAVDCDEDKCPVNFNKILLVDYVGNVLITCGSEKDGSCQTRAIDSITEPISEDDTPVAAPEKLSTEAIISPGPTLYVAATYDDERYIAEVYPVTKRSLSNEINRFRVENNAKILFTSRGRSVGFIINYITAYIKKTHYDDITYNYTYFVTSQRQGIDKDNLFEKNYFSKISRVCQDTDKELHSYAEILLNCHGTSDNYNLIQAAYVGPAGPNLAQSLGLNDSNDVFYGVFVKQEGVDGNIPSNQTALCVYKLEDIEEKFIDGIHGCLKDGDDFGLNYLQGHDCPQLEVVIFTDGPAASSSVLVSRKDVGKGMFMRPKDVSRAMAEGQQCTAKNWAFANAYHPLVATAVLEWSDIQSSSIITATHINHTIAYVGTAEGYLIKVHLENGTHGREYERFSLGSPVLRDAKVDTAQELVTILTEQTLFKLRVENCSEYTTCVECIGVNGGNDGDPYCGWCTLEKMCTRYNACPMPEVSTRWLPYNSAQCVDVSNVVPLDNLPITATQQQITLTVAQLPNLYGDHYYQCVFDNTSTSRADKFGNQLNCRTPAKSDIPKILHGNDHVTMQLYVMSTETNVKFVERTFYFYECNTHKMCVACTNSSWACDWCIYSNMCTHHNNKCLDDDSLSIISGKNMSFKYIVIQPTLEFSIKQGYEMCPQLDAQDGKIFVPDGVSKSIQVTGVNLPDEAKAASYQCVLNIEGVESVTGATRSGDIFTCGVRMYTYGADVSALDVELSVVWNTKGQLDDIHGFLVTLYKCDIGRPDCRRCLSNLTAIPKLKCGWCSTNNKCTVQGSQDCSSGWMSKATNDNCPNPYLSEVQPPSGPFKGNTTIAILGTDLGKQFSDITAIKVGAKNCNKTGLEKSYKAGSSVSCKTMSGANNSMEDITMTIKGANGYLQHSTGLVQFTYRDPYISSFKPQEGLTAGGTVVTISGQYLDACSKISATIGSECIMNRIDDVINTTTARCRTTGAPVGSSYKLYVSFDGTKRQSQNNFTYRPNPIITAVQPLKTIESGGITLTVMGTGFKLAQTPQIVMYIDDEQFKANCQVFNGTMMLCRTPNTKVVHDNILRQKRAAKDKSNFGFIIGNVTDLLRWSNKNNVTIERFEDPTYILFEQNTKDKSGDNELIMGRNLDDASSIIDVTVYIGTVKAKTISLDTNVLTIRLPTNNPGTECINGNHTQDPCVLVYHGNLKVYIGTIRYPSVTNIGIITTAVLLCLLIIIAVVLLVLYRYKLTSHQRNINKLVIEMEELENNIADDINAAFVQLQTDMTDLTSDLKGVGMPYVPHRQYAISMFFVGLETRPLTKDPKRSDEAEERAILELSKLLSNKLFLMALIQTLDEDKSVPNKDRLAIASLLTVLMIMENKLPFLTDVMFTVMATQLHDAIEDGKPTRVFQRTEFIVEKLLSNWIALSLYDFLKDHTAYPLFILYRAIKCQSEKGPIDAISGKSLISLSDENIITEKLNFEPLTMHVIMNEEDGEKKEVSVLDVDTIDQVKSKILDGIHGNKAYSCRMQPWQVDLVVEIDHFSGGSVMSGAGICLDNRTSLIVLASGALTELRHGKSGHVVLQDIDVSSESEPGWKKINTLRHFNIPDGSSVSLAVKQDVPNARVTDNAATICPNVHGSVVSDMPQYQVEAGVQLWHLVKEDNDDIPTSKPMTSKMQLVKQKKQIKEVVFPRLLGTKGTVQKYMDNMFAAILNTDNVPVGIKYVFDFFDGIAVRHNIEDESVIHTWKSNILPLRFWQKVISNPQYIFDINQTQWVEASLSVISQAFYDAFRKNPEQISKVASYRKLLYNREIPQYQNMVRNYYESISQMQRVSKSVLDTDLNHTCQKFTGLFSRFSTLLELQKLLVKYQSELIEALEEDENYQRAQLPEKLAATLGMM